MFINELLVEIGNKAYQVGPLSKFDVPKSPDDSSLGHKLNLLKLHKAYRFKNEEGLEYGILFYFTRDENKNSGREISFYINTPQGPKFDKSDTGDEFKILSTVKNVLQAYLQKYNPDFISFSGASVSHNDLYDKFVSNVDKFIPNWTRGPTIADDYGNLKFTLVPKNKKVKLTFNYPRV